MFENDRNLKLPNIDPKERDDREIQFNFFITQLRKLQIKSLSDLFKVMELISVMSGTRSRTGCNKHIHYKL